MYLTQKQIENISEKIVKEYYLVPGINSRPVFSINPVLLCEKVLGVNIGYAELSPDGSVLGATSFEDIDLIYRNEKGDEVLRLEMQKGSILIDRSLAGNEQMRGRHNFTVAHEAGHVILKKFFYGEHKLENGPHFCKKTGIENAAFSDPEEWQANAIASALLMPKENVSYFFEAFGVNKPLRIYGTKLLRREKKILSAFCEFFDVSKTCAVIRLSQLGYFVRCSQKQFIRDYDLDLLTGGRI